MSIQIQFKFPEALDGMFAPAPYKVFYGGRGGAKSHSIARALLAIGCSKKIRVLCCREFQASMSDSVHKLLKDIIYDYGLSKFYTVYNNSIIGLNGSEFLFVGLGRNVASIKSIERITHCWVEEAQTITQASLDVLLPTIRAENAEIWFSLNPIMETDPVYSTFIKEPPPNTLLFPINWKDNPWFPNVLLNQMEEAYRRDPTSAENIWGGIPKSSVDGAIYAGEMQMLLREQRICKVPYDPVLPVNTYWDLGFNDTTAVWFGQHTPNEHRFIDYYEASGMALPNYVKMLREKPYIYGEHFLPHDVEVSELSTGRSRLATLKSLGMNNITVVPRIENLLDGIEATRQMFHKCWFDGERCAEGLKALKAYQRKFNEETKTFSQKPLHNWASNGCLTGDTLVDTSRGSIPIARVVIGDRVNTPVGYMRVTASGVTKLSSLILEITATDGRVIEATPEHKFFTTEGLVYADTLSYNDFLLDRGMPWKNLNCSNSVRFREDFIESFKGYDIGVTNKGIYPKLKRGIRFFTGLSGSFIKGSYQNAKTYYEKIGKILIMKVGCYLEAPILIQSISTPTKSSMDAGITGCPTGITTIGQLQHYFIGRYGSFTTGLFRTIATYTIWIKIKPIVTYLTSLSSPFRSILFSMQRTILGWGQMLTRLSSKESAIWLKTGIAVLRVGSGIVPTARKCGQEGRVQRFLAQYAASYTEPHTLPGQSIVVGLVSIKRVLKEVPVYDLTVENAHCYYANGFLVSNSDSFRQFGQGFRVKTTRRPSISRPPRYKDSGAGY
jgi:phage terminase large subunit